VAGVALSGTAASTERTRHSRHCPPLSVAFCPQDRAPTVVVNGDLPDAG
jgi:hypothetical protein